MTFVPAKAAYRSEEGESLKAYEEKSCACH